jgi:hypothetical protein
MTLLTFTAADPFTVIDVAALADVLDREAAATARQYADAAYATFLVATCYDGLMPEGTGRTSTAYALSQIAEYAADAEAAADHVERGTKEYAEDFDHCASAAKYAARMASALLDGLSQRLADLDAATGRAA